ncbi:MAG: kynureninase [Acidiferrobacteraceae bacterium]|nr:kynureninase [Acidiferrobacteraceae bacterium]
MTNKHSQLQTGREQAIALDATDELACYRDQFALADDTIYLDGNSLGALPKKSVPKLLDVVNREWGNDLICSWEVNGWMDLPITLGNKIAQVIGAGSEEVVVCDSTSINLYKALSAALSLNPHRTSILSDNTNFPTDLYVANGLISNIGRNLQLELVARHDIEDSISAEIAVVYLTHVEYLTGGMCDLSRITKVAHDHGALVVWDLSHSAGVIPINLKSAGADFAVGCGYKFLNGGPGAPAYIYVKQDHQRYVESPLKGWLGHSNPFRFEERYHPADGIRRMLCGSPPILSMVCLDTAIDLLLSSNLSLIRDKSIKLSNLLIEQLDLISEELGLCLLTPRNPSMRGSQVSVTHPDAIQIRDRMLQSGVIVDFRPPNILRFGLAPLYTRYTDIWEAIQSLRSAARDL